MFQIVRMALDDSGEVIARRALQPLFELWEDAVAMAEFDASRLWGDYGWDEEQSCWWATDSRGQKYRLAIEAVERGRTPVLVLDEAHLLDHAQLEGIRMLTLCRARGYAEATTAATGSPWQVRRGLPGRSA